MGKAAHRIRKGYQASITNAPVENGGWSKERKERHDLSGTLVSVTTAPVEEYGYIRSARRSLLS